MSDVPDEFERLSTTLTKALAARAHARRDRGAPAAAGRLRRVGERMLTREEALMLLHDHWEEECYLALWALVPDELGGAVGVIEFHGLLTNPLGPEDAADLPGETRDIMGALYMIGGHPFTLPALPGAIWERDHGLDFELTDGLTLRIGWARPDVP